MRNVIVIISLLLVSMVVSAQNVEKFISVYQGENANGYLRPLNDVITSAFHAQVVNNAKVDKKFHLELGVVASGSFITSNLKTFTATTEGDFEPKSSAKVSTIVGPGKSVIVEGVNGTAYEFTAGMGTKYIPLAVPQLSLGALYGTDVHFRFFAWDLGSDIGKLQLIGGGVRHSISQYFKKEVIDLSVGYAYQNVKIKDHLDLTTHLAAAYAGQQIGLFNYYVLAGYQYGKMKVNYDFGPESAVVPIEVNVINKNPFIAGVGAGVKLWKFQINAEVSFPTPIVVSAGLGLHF